MGTIFAGATHDHLTGMLSMRHGGASVSELIGKYLGKSMRQVMTIWTAMLLVMLPAVCMTYILQAPEGLDLPTAVAYPGGIVFAAVCLALFFRSGRKRRGALS